MTSACMCASYRDEYASDKIHELLVLAAESAAAPDRPSELTAAERDLCALGFESLLWRLWLKQNHLLGQPEFRKQVSVGRDIDQHGNVGGIASSSTRRRSRQG